MVPMKIRPGEFQAAGRGPQAAGPLDSSRHSGLAATADLSRPSGAAAKAGGIHAGSVGVAQAKSNAPSSRCDGSNPPDFLGRRHDPPAFPRRIVVLASRGLGPVRVSLSKRGPAASLRLSAGQRSSSLGWLRKRSRAHAPTPNVTGSFGLWQRGLGRAAQDQRPSGRCRDCHPSQAAALIHPPHFQRKLDVGVACPPHFRLCRIWAWLAAARLGHVVAARRRSEGIGAVHPGLCPKSINLILAGVG
jgi:hypothetical protein